MKKRFSALQKLLALILSVVFISAHIATLPVSAVGYTAPIIIINSNVWASNVGVNMLRKSGNVYYITIDVFSQLPYMTVEKYSDGSFKLTNGISEKFLKSEAGSDFVLTDLTQQKYMPVLNEDGNILVPLQSVCDYMKIKCESKEKNGILYAVRIADITTATTLDDLLEDINVTAVGDEPLGPILMETRIYITVEAENIDDAVELSELLYGLSATAVIILDFDQIMNNPAKVMQIYSNRCTTAISLDGMKIADAEDAIQKCREISAVTKVMPLVVSVQYLSPEEQNSQTAKLERVGFLPVITDNFIDDNSMDIPMLTEYISRRLYQRTDLYFRISRQYYSDLTELIENILAIGNTSIYCSR